MFVTCNMLVKAGPEAAFLDWYGHVHGRAVGSGAFGAALAAPPFP